jgi:integrase/recombinase XerC
MSPKVVAFRCAYLATKPLIEALEVYLAYRLDRKIGTDLYGKTHRGLLPNQPLIYSSRGAGLSQNSKRRVLDSGVEKIYKCCDSLQSHLTMLYQKAGIQGSSHSGRRTFASKILASTGDMDTVATLLGHSDISCSARYVDLNITTLQDMFTSAV